MKQTSLPTPEEIEDRLYSLRPMRWYLILWVAMLYVWALPFWQYSPSSLALFTALMLAHGLGHWFSLSLSRPRRRLWLYCAVQAALVASISLVTRNPLVTLMLYMEMIGAAILLVGQVRQAIGLVIGYLVLAIPNLILLVPGYNLTLALMFSLPVAFIVVGVAALFLQQANDRVRMRTLLRELEAAHRQLADYAGRVEDLTLAAERQRMARELHDTLAQGLAGLILQLEAASSHLSEGRPERAQTIIRQAMARARTTLADARHAIDDLRHGQADPLDLAEAIHAEVDRFTSATGIPCALDLALHIPLPDAVYGHVQRAVAEGLMNVARHARASQVWVEVVSLDDHVEIEVRDNGAGFDPAAVEAQAGHYGLLGMRERARLAGGTLEVSSTPGRGTALRLHLPLSPEAVNQ
jgi:NarL family two-component system sensor histidine kinase YdfH